MKICKGEPTHKQTVTGHKRKLFKAGEAAKVKWDVIHEVDISEEIAIESLYPQNWD